VREREVVDADSGLKSRSPAPAPAAASSSSYSPPAFLEAPAALFQPEVIALADKHKRSLVALWAHYSGASRALAGDSGAGGPYGCKEGLDIKRFVTLFADFDIAPTFLSKKELKGIFSAAALCSGAAPVASSSGSGGESEAGPEARLSYAAFIESLGRAALTALSKPAFQHLYPSARDKLACLLEMWGLADARQLAEVARRGKSAAGSVATAATSVRH